VNAELEGTRAYDNKVGERGEDYSGGGEAGYDSCMSSAGGQVMATVELMQRELGGREHDGEGNVTRV